MGEDLDLPMVQTAYRTHEVVVARDYLLRAADASLLAYKPGELSDGWRRQTIPREGSIFGASETVFLINEDRTAKIVEVAIRGTESFDDVLRDLNDQAVLDEHLRVPLHSGFRSVAHGIADFLMMHYTREEHKFKLYGHSLGGAVASIVGMYLHHYGYTVNLVGTFGAPRFTTNEGARKYQVLNQRIYRVVRCDDVIPFLPPPNFFGWTNGSYEANGNLLLLLAPPYFDYSVGLDIERDFTHQLRLDLTNVAKREPLVFGHKMENYRALLSRLISYDGMKTFPHASSNVRPVSYQLAMQAQLCPAGLIGKPHEPR